MNYKETAAKIVELVGGKDNLEYATHCLTRLRLTPKDRSLIEEEKLIAMPEVVGTKSLGTQYQIIIGPDVRNVYEALCEVTGMSANAGIEENLDAAPAGPKEKLTIKSVLSKIMDVLGGCIAPMLPIITAAGLIKMIAYILGPGMMNVLADTSNAMIFLTFVGDAGFYFFPFYVAFAAAKKFNTNTSVALFLAGIMLHPTLMGIVAEGTPFDIFGIPMIGVNYSTSFLPMILTCWVMSYFDTALKKIVPASLQATFSPLLLVLIMAPLALCVLGPVGTIVGNAIADSIVWLHSIAGPLAIALVAAMWPFLISTGMHQALIAIAITYIAANGYDASILVGAIISNYPMIALACAYSLKAKTAQAKSFGISSLITLAVGGVSEPTLFGIILQNSKAMLYMVLGGLAGGFYAGLMHIAVYIIPTGNLLVAIAFGPDLVQGAIASVIAFAVTFVAAMVLGFETKKEKEAAHEQKAAFAE